MYLLSSKIKISWLSGALILIEARAKRLSCSDHFAQVEPHFGRPNSFWMVADTLYLLICSRCCSSDAVWGAPWTRTTTWCEFSHALPEQREGVPSGIPSHIDSHYGRVVGTIPTDRQSWLPPPTPTDAVVRLQVLSHPDHLRPTAFTPSPALLVVACQPSPPPSPRRLLNQGEAPRRTLTRTLFPLFHRRRFPFLPYHHLIPLPSVWVANSTDPHPMRAL